MKLGKTVENKIIDSIIQKQRPGECCVLIYTSGTTGNPKGVMISHDNLIFNGAAISTDFINKIPDTLLTEPENKRMVSYLPLSHIAGLMSDIVGQML